MSLYAYLNTSNLLETGSEQDIANAKKTYRKAYKAAWKQQYKKSHTYITLSLTQAEAKQISEAAKNYRRGRPRFIKEACFAYLDKRYLVPDVVALGAIRQMLGMNFNLVQKMFEENRLSYEIGTVLLQQMGELERKVLVELYHPKEIVLKTEL